MYCCHIKLRLEVVINLIVGLKLTVFLKVISREDFSANSLFMHYSENLHQNFRGIKSVFISIF
ncbi:MAG: hypothetical protein B1H05_04895 [Candidatus Cloacimonas sp. 4484_140]|nr:MAG: hypothetical protein B1H05_04895 [Candidatus Cloacimonas sp. 4484_140]